MPRKSKHELLEDRIIEEIQASAFAPDVSQTAKSKYLQTLSALLRRRAKRIAEKQAVARARKAIRDQENHRYPNVLPWNGIGPDPNWKPGAPVKPFEIPAGINKG
jgi:hypothetical protein